MSEILGVLVTYRRPRALATALDALRDAEPRPSRLIVFDNAPSDETARIVGGHPWVEYVASPTNVGPAGGRAVGMERLLTTAADDDHIVFFDDDDPLPSPSVLRDLHAFANVMRATDPTTAGVGLRGSWFDRRRGYPRPIRLEDATGPVAADYLHCGFFPFHSVRAIRDVGVFGEDLMYGWTDVEYGLRLRAAGYSLYVSAELWREHGTRMGHPVERDGPALRLPPVTPRRYYMMRNWIHVLRRYASPVTTARVLLLAGLGKPLANLPRQPRLALAHLHLNARAAADAFRGVLGPAPNPWSGAPSEVEI